MIFYRTSFSRTLNRKNCAALNVLAIRYTCGNYYNVYWTNNRYKLQTILQINLKTNTYYYNGYTLFILYWLSSTNHCYYYFDILRRYVATSNINDLLTIEYCTVCNGHIARDHELFNDLWELYDVTRYSEIQSQLYCIFNLFEAFSLILLKLSIWSRFKIRWYIEFPL